MPRKVESKRWRRDIAEHLAQFPRQYAALESAMAAFGEDFDLKEFKAAFDTTEDMEAYNHVQALERALGRVQNFVAELAESAVKLAELPPPSTEAGGSAARAFESLREAGAIDGSLRRRLVRAQVARATIEHGYLQVSAGDVHRAAELVHDAARDFIGRYRVWIEPHLADGSPERR